MNVYLMDDVSIFDIDDIYYQYEFYTLYIQKVWEVGSGHGFMILGSFILEK